MPLRRRGGIVDPWDALQVGDKVKLSRSWRSVADAARGPLQRPDKDVGVVVQRNVSGGGDVSLQVRYKGTTWYYVRGSLVSATSLKPAPLRLGDRVVLAPPKPASKKAAPARQQPPATGGCLADAADIGIVISAALRDDGSAMAPAAVQVRSESGATWWYDAAALAHAPAALASVPLPLARALSRGGAALGATSSYAEWLRPSPSTQLQPAAPLPQALSARSLPPKPHDPTRDADGALHLAAAGGHVAVLKALLDTRVLPAGSWGAAGRTALHAAAAANSPACVAVLLAAGADPNAPAAAGDKGTPLHVAAAAGAAAVIQALVAAGASIAARNAVGATPRDIAASNAARRVLDEAAAAAKAEADAKAAATATLFAAVTGDDCAALRAIMETQGGAAVVAMRDAATQRSLLHAACAGGAGAAATLLLDAGADATAADGAGNTPLHAAVSARDAAAALELTTNLLSRGAGADVPNAKGHTPLHVACLQARDAEAIVRALLAAGAEASTRTTRGKATPAHMACAAGQKGALMALLAHGAELEPADVAGATPLHAAAASHALGAAACVAALISARASPLRRNGDGKTPGDVAQEPAVAAQLKAAAKAAARSDPAARWAAEVGRPDFKPVPAIDKLMTMTGLNSVKHAVLTIYYRVLVIAERNRQNGTTKSVMSEAALHMRFDGNPGTGKTTVARHVAAALHQMGVVATDVFVEQGGAAMLSDGLNEFKKLITGKLGKGGVLFIDEAPQLAPKTDKTGAQIVNYLLKEMEDRRDNLCCIVAGYGKEMDELFTFNPGLPSRFPQQITFEDFEYFELLEILRDMVAAEGYCADAKPMRIAAKRLERARGSQGFGNARAVRSYFEASVGRQRTRLALACEDGARLGGNLNVLTRADLLGPCQMPARMPAVQQLESMVGLTAVKLQVRKMLAMMEENLQREENEEPPLETCLNRLFLGNPGTGKTTVGQLYGRILKEMGWLSKGDLICVTPADFKGTVVGESERRTIDILNSARGNVLLIDEAYDLNDSSPYMKSVVSTIVSKVQPTAGEDIAVLLLGYKDEMEEMMRNSNGGFARRFQPHDPFIFEDYDDEALRVIMLGKAKNFGLEVLPEAADVAIAHLSRQRQKLHFGNAGAVDSILGRAKESLALRCAEAVAAGTPLDATQRRTIIATDFEKEPAAPPEDALAHLVGADAARAKLEELRAAVASAQARGSDPWSAIEPCFVFKGPPGCGKTSLARAMGQMFCSLGLLADSGVVEKTASSLQTGIVGQAGTTMRAAMDEALGRVLLIDEAYLLGTSRGTYNDEIVAELVACLTLPKYKGKMIVIMAGYQAEMDHFMATTNPGLSSRFSEHLVLQAFTPQVAAEVGAQLCAEQSLTLTPAGAAAMLQAFEQMAAQPGWASGRHVETLIKKASRKVNLRTHGRGALPGTTAAAAMGAEDVEAAAAELMAQAGRAERDPPGLAARPNNSGFFLQDGGGGGQRGGRPPVRPSGRGGGSAMVEATAVAEATATVEQMEHDQSDDSASDLWACLERACVQCGLSAHDILPDLQAGRAPERVVTVVAAELGRPVPVVREMLGAQAPALLARVQRALAEATRIQEAAATAAATAAEDDTQTLNRQWICSFCHNSNPGCPYRARQEGGYFAEL